MMDQTILNTTIALKSHKAEEKMLSENIYKNLHMLTLFNPPSANFNAVFVKDMFVKPNTKAFPHIAHFLFTTLDAKEFKKRFFWPTYDKNSESNFRTSALNYLNYLKEKYNLNFDTLKTHFVVIPGGIKFMKVVLELSRLVMREEIKKRNGSQIPQRSITTADLTNILQELKTMQERAEEYQQELEMNTEFIKIKTQELNFKIDSIFVENEIKNIQLLEDTFAKTWSDKINTIVEVEMKPDFNLIIKFNKECQTLNQIITTLLEDKQKKFIKFDADLLKCIQASLKKIYPNQHEEISNIVQNNSINFANLFCVFELILPNIIETIQNYTFKDLEILKYESSEIENMLIKVTALEKKITNFEMFIQNYSKLIDSNKLSYTNLVNIDLRNKLMCTPYIAYGSLDNDKKAPISNRLSLMDDKTFCRQQLFDFNQTLTTTKISRSNQSFDLSLCKNVNTSRVADPMNILRMITNKQNQRIHNGNNSQTGIKNISTCTFVESIKTELPPSIASTPLNVPKIKTVLVSPLFNDKNPRRIYTEKLFETTNPVSPEAIIYQKKYRTNSIIEMQNHFLNLHSFETSPSGRLDTLVKFNQNEQILNSCSKDKISKQRSYSKLMAPQNKESIKALRCDMENNLNISNIMFEEEESLFNISDTVLQDIEM